MIATSCLLAFLLVAAVIDFRLGIIPNKVVYPGILFGMLVNAAVSIAWLSRPDVFADREFWGWVGMGDSLIGLLSCGGVMLVCFVLFAGQVGGGDVKLLAMIGAWWGVQRGLEAMLWTLVIGAVVAIVSLIWKLGALQLLRRIWSGLTATWRTGGNISPDEEDRRLLRTPLRLAPSAVVAVLVVQFRLMEGW